MVKHILNILKILGSSLVDLLFILIGLLVVPVALLGRYKSGTNIKLPKWAFYWDNMDYGCLGDGSWRTIHHPDDYDSFLNMYKWLAIRNPAFNWGIISGIYGVVSLIQVHGTQTRVDNYIKYQGAAWRELWMEDGSYKVQYSVCYAYPDWFGENRYGFRLQIGPFIQAAKAGEFNALGHSLLIQPFKKFEK